MTSLVARPSRRFPPLYGKMISKVCNFEVLCLFFSSEYICKNYGQCKVIHTWEQDGQGYDSDGVPLQDKFALVVKFALSSVANQTKQK
jgi:hypothetical protein